MEKDEEVCEPEGIGSGEGDGLKKVEDVVEEGKSTVETIEEGIEEDDDEEAMGEEKEEYLDDKEKEKEGVVEQEKSTSLMNPELEAAGFEEYAAGSIYIKEYAIKYSMTQFLSRMTVIILSEHRIFIHSPCEIDEVTKRAIETLGDVRFIVAPGTFHHLHVPSCQAAFPNAKTYICHGVEKKRKDLHYDGFLEDGEPLEEWKDEMDQIFMHVPKMIQEVVFLHKKTKTLIVVDLIEHFTEKTPGTNKMLRFFWKYIFRKWNKCCAAPEYFTRWTNKKEVKEICLRILDWDFDKVILAHGDLIFENAKDACKEAWSAPLNA